SLVEFLVESGQKELAGNALRELVGLLSRGRDKFSEVSLEKVAIKGSEFKNRILFLTSLGEDEKFDEKSYREWVAERERIEAKKIAEEIAAAEKVSLSKPGRVARPRSELEKFLDLSEEEIPPSPTQAAEEELMEEELGELMETEEENENSAESENETTPLEETSVEPEEAASPPAE
ncbi:MAG: hypothetical protein ABIE14_02815, partial [Patescibacteria group bacterium]